MAKFDLFCPTCHSRIGDIEEETLGIVQGSLGIDANGLPVPRWTDDPMKTSPLGLSGSGFIGNDRIKAIHFKELQEARALEEIEANIPTEFLTDFSEIDANNTILERHFVELRESVEKILDAVGSDLDEYFNINADLNSAVPGPFDTAKDEWTDIERGREYVRKDGKLSGTFRLPSSTDEDDTTLSPTIPTHTLMKAIWFEDLRHTIPIQLFFEYYSVSPAGFVFESPDPVIPNQLRFQRKLLFPTDVQIRVFAASESIQKLLDNEPPNQQIHGPVNFDAIDAGQGWWRMMIFEKRDENIKLIFPDKSCQAPIDLEGEIINFANSKFEVKNGVTLPGEPKPTVKAFANQTIKMTSFSKSVMIGDLAAIAPSFFSCEFFRTRVQTAMGLEMNVAPVEPIGFVFVPGFPVASGVSNFGNTLQELHDDVKFPLFKKATFTLNDDILFKWHQESDVKIEEELKDYAHPSFEAAEGLGGSGPAICFGKTEIEDPRNGAFFKNIMEIRMSRAVVTLPLDPTSPSTIIDSSTNELNIKIRFYKDEAQLDEILEKVSILPLNQLKQKIDGYTFVNPITIEKDVPFSQSTNVFGSSNILQPALAIFLDDLSSPLGGPNYEIDFRRMLNAWVKAMPKLTENVFDPDIAEDEAEEAFQSLYISQELVDQIAEDEKNFSLEATVSFILNLFRNDIERTILPTKKELSIAFGLNSVIFFNHTPEILAALRDFIEQGDLEENFKTRLESAITAGEVAHGNKGPKEPLVPTIADLKDIKLYLSTSYLLMGFQFSSGSFCSRTILGRVRVGEITATTSFTGFRIEDRPEEP